jgi:hypothetical protein
MTTPKNEFRHIGYLNKSQIVVCRNVDCTTRRRSYDLVSPVDVFRRRRIRRRRLIQRNRKTLRVDDQLWGGVTSSQSDSLHDSKILFFFKKLFYFTSFNTTTHSNITFSTVLFATSTTSCLEIFR